MNKDLVKRRSILPSTSLLDAMKKMDEVKVKYLFVFQEERFCGLVTIGDIQRAIIKSIPLTQQVGKPRSMRL